MKTEQGIVKGGGQANFVRIAVKRGAVFLMNCNGMDRPPNSFAKGGHLVDHFSIFKASSTRLIKICKYSSQYMIRLACFAPNSRANT
jgi:hypothetical protein